MAKKEQPKRGVGAVAIEALRAGKTNEEVLAIVKEEFPDAKTTLASINWYRGKLRADGVTLKGSSKPVPTSREMRKPVEKKKPSTKGKANGGPLD